MHGGCQAQGQHQSADGTAWTGAIRARLRAALCPCSRWHSGWQHADFAVAAIALSSPRQSTGYWLSLLEPIAVINSLANEDRASGKYRCALVPAGETCSSANSHGYDLLRSAARPPTPRTGDSSRRRCMWRSGICSSLATCAWICSAARLPSWQWHGRHTHTCARAMARHSSPCGLPLPSSGPSADRCRSSGAMPRRACRHALTGAAMPFFYILSGFVMTLGYGQTTYGECSLSGAITELRSLVP